MALGHHVRQIADHAGHHAVLYPYADHYGERGQLVSVVSDWLD